MAFLPVDAANSTYAFILINSVPPLLASLSNYIRSLFLSYVSVFILRRAFGLDLSTSTVTAWIQVYMFFDMSDTRRWIVGLWTTLTRDGPPDISPAQEVGEAALLGLPLLIYIPQSAIWHRHRMILNLVWSNLRLIFLTFIGAGTLLVLSAFAWTKLKALADRKAGSYLKFSLSSGWLIVTLPFLVVRTICLPFDLGIALFSDVRRWVHDATGAVWQYRNKKRILQRYEYESLNIESKKIRLVKLERLTPLSEVRCHLKRFPLSNAPAYEAISCMWGSQKLDHVTIFDDRSLLVTKNVYNILHDRASCVRVRWLWIDAICINQVDPSEKNFQVAMMGNIHIKADRVVVWLGDYKVRHREINCVIGVLFRLKYEKVLYKEHQSSLRRREHFISDTEMWNALRRLASHPCWKRAWIIQEIAKGTEAHILYGGRYIHWVSFVDTVDPLLSKDGREVAVRDTMLSGVEMFSISDGLARVAFIASCRVALSHLESPHLGEYLISSASCAATDPRDKIFAISNLIDQRATEETIEEIKPDYNKSVEEVFTSVALYLLRRSPELVLQRNGIGYPRKIHEVPSWVPDWTAYPLELDRKALPKSY